MSVVVVVFVVFLIMLNLLYPLVSEGSVVVTFDIFVITDESLEGSSVVYDISVRVHSIISGAISDPTGPFSGTISIINRVICKL